MTTLDLQSLVGFCLSRRANASTFQQLVKELNHKQEITPQDVKTVIAQNKPYESLLAIYIAYTSLIDQPTVIKPSIVLSSLPSALDINQEFLLNAFITEIKEQKDLSLSSIEINQTVTSIFAYIRHIIEQNHDSGELFIAFGTFLLHFLPILPEDSLSQNITPEHNDLLTSLLTEIKLYSIRLAAELEEKINRRTRRSSLGIHSQLPSSLPSTALTFSSHSTFLKSNKLPKLIWLNNSIRNWSTHKKGFIDSFSQFVKLKTNQNILNELIACSFEGYAVSLQSKDQTTFFNKNWKLFLLKRLPLLIKELNLKTPETSITNAINLVDPKVSQSIKLSTTESIDSTYDDMFSSFPTTTTDIRHGFVRACISLELLPSTSYTSILKQDSAADSRPLSSSDDVFDENGSVVDLVSTFNRTLIDINTEFIPLEDSGFLEFLNLIENMEGTKQLEVSQLILSTWKNLIENEDTSHIYRLSLGLALSPEPLHAILFHLSPLALVKPIMNMLDKWQINTDDMNFQDAYSGFGCVFLLLLLIVKNFNITIEELISCKDDPSNPSFTISYLTTMGSSIQSDQLDSHASEVLNSWITALFDSGGISDDLMRLSTVQECFDLFPNIFQQAFIGCKQNLVDLETVRGGLEYFLQPFLLGTIVGILSWATNYLWKQQDVDLLVTLLKTLITPMDLSGESVHIHKVVLSIFSKELYDVLSSYDTNTNVDPVLLSTLSQNKAETSSSKLFELNLSFLPHTGGSQLSRSNDTASLFEIFHAQFYALINWSQTSVLPSFEFQSFVTLISLLGPKKIFNYLIAQINHTHSTNLKNSHLLLEFSSFVLSIYFAGGSNRSKNYVLSSLKEGVSKDTLPHSIETGEFVQTLLEAKSKADPATAELVGVFYDKIYESVQTLSPLE